MLVYQRVITQHHGVVLNHFPTKKKKDEFPIPAAWSATSHPPWLGCDARSAPRGALSCGLGGWLLVG